MQFLCGVCTDWLGLHEKTWTHVGKRSELDRNLLGEWVWPILIGVDRIPIGFLGLGNRFTHSYRNMVSTGSMEIFIKGTTFDGRSVKLDPVRDARIPRNYVLSSDLDSIIVTAHRLKVQGDVNIEVLLYSGRQPPIPKSNHTYVELLMPQSENGVESGGRTEWFSTHHLVSAILHMPFCCEYTDIFPFFLFIIYSLNYFPDIFSIYLFKACYSEVTNIFLQFSH